MASNTPTSNSGDHDFGFLWDYINSDIAKAKQMRTKTNLAIQAYHKKGGSLETSFLMDHFTKYMDDTKKFKVALNEFIQAKNKAPKPDANDFKTKITSVMEMFSLIRTHGEGDEQVESLVDFVSELMNPFAKPPPSKED